MAVKLLKHTLKRNRFGDDLSKWHKCRKCGSNNGAVGYVPGRVMGGVWVNGFTRFHCSYCEEVSYLGR
jgi:hypothetical protein